MNKKFNLIMNILIVILIVALVFVMMNYYVGNSEGIPTNTDKISEDILPSNKDGIITNNSGTKENTNDAIIVIEISGDIENDSGETEGISGEKIEVSGEAEGMENEVVLSDKNPIKNETPKDENKTLIITSENEISSKEKKEILTELDKTLMELLDVVDKVQAVDETRLIVDDSEVQG